MFCYNVSMQKAPLAARKPIKEISINGETYDIPHRQGAAITDLLVKMWEKLGKPEDPFSVSGEKLMQIIIATWEDTYPEESRQWYEDRKEYKLEELDIKTQVRRKTGRSLASYPYYIFTIMKIVFPKVKFSDRKIHMKMVKKYPMFLFANKA